MTSTIHFEVANETLGFASFYIGNLAVVHACVISFKHDLTLNQSMYSKDTMTFNACIEPSSTI